MKDTLIVQELSDVFLNSLLGSVPKRGGVWYCVSLKENTNLKGTIQNDPSQTTRGKEIVAKAIRQWFYHIESLVLGCTNPICQKERWIDEDVCRLPRVEQSNYKE